MPSLPLGEALLPGTGRCPPLRHLLAQLASRMAIGCEYDLSTTPIVGRK